MKKRDPLALFLGLMMLVMMSAAYAGPVKDAKAFGKTYGEWSARWWQFVLAIPSSSNPLLDETGQHCARGQLAPGNKQVWFLAGTFGGSAERSCNVPKGKALFFPLINAFFINDVGEAFTEAEKREGLASLLDFSCDLKSTLNGAPTIISQTTVRTQSPVFPVVVGPDNVFGVTEGVSDEEVVADGYWVMLPPLPKGDHQLAFSGAFCDPVTHEPFFSVDVIYNLTVH